MGLCPDYQQTGLCPDYQQTAYETMAVFLEIQHPSVEPLGNAPGCGLHSCCTCAFSVRQLSGPLPEHAEGPVLTVWAAFTEL